MPHQKYSFVVYIAVTLFLAAAAAFPALAHNSEDAHSAPPVPQANVPMELVAGTVIRTVVENKVTSVTTQYVALRGDDGKPVALGGKGLDALQNGARAEAIGWRNGSTFAVSAFRTVVATKSQTTRATPTSQVEGTLLLAHVDYLDNGRGEYLYMLRDDSGHMTRLNLASADGLEPGMRITVHGTLSVDGKSMDVDLVTVTAGPPPPPLTQGQPVTQAVTNNVLVILLKFTDSPASDPFTQAQVQDVMTNATTGVAHYYSEVSYGAQILNVTVTNWLVGKNASHTPAATPPNCDFDTMGTYGDTAAADAGYPRISYQNHFYVMPPNGACGFSGVAYIQGDTAWSNGVNDIKVYAHELGHNFNLYHAASLSCAGGAAIGGTCSSSEYGDPFDVMGNISSMHFNTVQKAKLGWIPASSVKTQGSGFHQYTLDALELAGGTTYAVTIPTPNANRTYWIEYRQPLGFDAGLSAANANGAQIRVANPFETCTGCQFFFGFNISDDTELLDMTAGATPGNFGDARLAVGSTFTDSTYGISVTVASANATQLVLNVSTPGGSATTTSLVSSLNPSIAGNSVTFTASVTGSSPTGTVNFTDGGTSIAGCGAVALTGAGNVRSAACSTAALTTGTRSIVAAYSGDGSNTPSTSSTLSQVVGGTPPTTTSVVSSLNPSTFGATVTLTASVTGNAPTGAVNFTDGGATISGCGAVALGGIGNTRTATCSTSALSATTHSIVAAYSGDAGNAASTSAIFSQVINKAASTTGLTSSANPASAGVNVSFTATVTGTAPTGTVAFTDGGTTIGTCSAVALTGAGNTRTATCSTSTLSATTHSIVAAYSGDAGNAASSSAPLSQVVNPVSSTATVSSSANPAVVASSVTFTASVTGNAPTGTVNFTDGGATIATCGAVALTGAGSTRTATCGTSTLSAGTHNIVAIYSGDAGNATSTSAPLSEVVNKVTSTTGLTSSANPASAGVNVSFTATVTGTAPTGTVAFTDGGATIAGCGAVALIGSGNALTATCATSTLSASTHSIVAAYAGNAGNAASSSAPLSQVVNPASSGTTVSSSANPAIVGTSVTFTASVTGNAPTGTVSFTDGGTTIGTCSAVALAGAGNTRTATCSTSALSAATHNIVAAYSGDAGNAASTSTTLSQVVNKVSSTTGLASSANPASAGASVTFTATVTGTAPTGTVAFTDGGATIGTCSAVALTGAGNTRSATCSTSTLSATTHSIVAAYSGNAGNATSSSAPLSQVVNPASSGTTVSSSANPTVVGTSVTFTASVTGNAPTGTVKFTDGGATIGTCSAVALTGAGSTRTATCSTSALSVATHSIVAVYSGDAGNATSSSTPLSQVVNLASSTTTVSSSANPTIIGATVTFTASVTGNAPAGSVKFTDGGATIGTCSAVALTGAGNTRTATCSTSALSATTHNIVAAFAGDAGNTASSSAPLSQVVNPAPSTTTVSSSANPTTVGTSVTFTASVTGNAPTGTVKFTDGGTTIGSCSTAALTGSGNPRTATCTTSALSAGIHSVVATYAGNAGNAPSSSAPMTQSVIGTTPVLAGAWSRRVHGSAGIFDLPLSLVSTNPTTEPRQGPAQTVVISFGKPITSATVVVTEGAAIAAAPMFSGNNVIVNLTGVTNRQYVTVTLSNVKAADGGTGGTGKVRLGFLVGDVSQNRVITLADAGLVNAALAQPVTTLNFLKDINASGSLTLADKAIVNASLSTALPPP
jgi:Bacterial Ig-like domain (group 3)